MITLSGEFQDSAEKCVDWEQTGSGCNNMPVTRAATLTVLIHNPNAPCPGRFAIIIEVVLSVPAGGVIRWSGSARPLALSLVLRRRRAREPLSRRALQYPSHLHSQFILLRLRSWRARALRTRPHWAMTGYNAISFVILEICV